MPFLVPIIISALISTAFSIAASLISAALTRKAGVRRQRQESQDQRQRQNITDTTARVPVVYGIARVGGLRVLAFTKNAYIGTTTVQSNGTEVEVDTRGDYLYQITVFCEGEIDDIQTVYIDGVNSTDAKFASPYRVNVYFNWIYSEPSPVQVFSAPTYTRLKQGSYLITEQQAYQQSWVTPYRYRLYRKPAAGGQRILLLNLTGQGATSPKTTALANTDYGNWIFELEYVKDTGEIISVGNATVSITQDNVDFVQSVNNNLNVSQLSGQDGAYIKSDEKHGSANQTAITFFLAEGVEGYNTNSVGNKLALMGHRLLKHTKGPNAEISAIVKIPEITAVIKGKLVYDPRTGLTVWSDNPALCVRDYLTNTIYGASIDESFIDDDAFSEAADYCDEIITNPDGTTMKRFTINGVIDTGKKLVDNIDQILDTCNGQLFYVQGKYGLRCLKPESTTYIFTTADIVGNITVKKNPLRTKVNKAKVRWINPSKNWTSDILTITDAALLAQDKGQELESEIDLDLITDYNHAYRLGTIFLKQNRLSLSIQFQSHALAYQCLAGDVIGITHPAYGWTNKKFRIQKMVATPDEHIDIEANEYNEAVYDVSNFDVEPEYGESNLSNPFFVQPASNIQIRQSFELDSLGNYQNTVYFDWLSSPSSAIVLYQIEYKPYGYGQWQVGGRTQTNSIKLINLSVGLYQVRVKAINNIGIESAYTTKDLEVVSINDIPPDVSDLTLQNGNNEIALSWTIVQQVANGGWYRIKHSANTTGAQWQDHPTFDVVVPGSQTSITLSQIDGTYMIKAVNIAGVESANEVKIILDLPDDSSFQTVLTQQADPTFPGTKDLTVVIDNKLSLDGSLLFDDAEGNFDDKIGNFDDAGGYSNVGSYTMSTSSDLGAIYKVKLSKDILATVTQIGNNFDDMPGNFDDAPGYFDGSSPINAAANILFRATNDDPSGSPSWSDWQLLTLNQTTGRAFQFRAELFTESTNEKVFVETMKCNVQLPLRVASASASITTSNQQVNFARGFYSTPTITPIITNPASGDYVSVSNITATGFQITCFNSAGATVNRNINYIAQGLGERQ